MNSLRQPLPVQLSPAGGDDLDAVMEIMADAFDPSFGEAWTRPQCAGILPMHGVVLTLAHADGVPVGFSLARSVADESELLLLAVRRQASRRGVGGDLLARFIEDARKAGTHRLHLEVRDGNPAVRLYERSGFRVAGRRSGYYHGPGGQDFDALTMVRTL